MASVELVHPGQEDPLVVSSPREFLHRVYNQGWMPKTGTVQENYDALVADEPPPTGTEGYVLYANLGEYIVADPDVNEHFERKVSRVGAKVGSAPILQPDGSLAFGHLSVGGGYGMLDGGSANSTFSSTAIHGGNAMEANAAVFVHDFAFEGVMVFADNNPNYPRPDLPVGVRAVWYSTTRPVNMIDGDVWHYAAQG